jgi:hypothetical protein
MLILDCLRFDDYFTGFFLFKACGFCFHGASSTIGTQRAMLVPENGDLAEVSAGLDQ